MGVDEGSMQEMERDKNDYRRKSNNSKVVGISLCFLPEAFAFTSCHTTFSSVYIFSSQHTTLDKPVVWILQNIKQGSCSFFLGKRK